MVEEEGKTLTHLHLLHLTSEKEIIMVMDLQVVMGVVVIIMAIIAIILVQEDMAEAQILTEEVVEATEVKETIMVEGATITQVGDTVQAPVDMDQLVAEMGDEIIMVQILAWADLVQTLTEGDFILFFFFFCT